MANKNNLFDEQDRVSINEISKERARDFIVVNKSGSVNVSKTITNLKKNKIPINSFRKRVDSINSDVKYNNLSRQAKSKIISTSLSQNLAFLGAKNLKNTVDPSKQAIWLPSTAKQPRPEHIINYGKRFALSKGIGGVLPGELINCQCGMRVIEINNTPFPKNLINTTQVLSVILNKRITKDEAFNTVSNVNDKQNILIPIVFFKKQEGASIQIEVMVVKNGRDRKFRFSLNLNQDIVITVKNNSFLRQGYIDRYILPQALVNGRRMAKNRFGTYTDFNILKVGNQNII